MSFKSFFLLFLALAAIMFIEAELFWLYGIEPTIFPVKSESN